VTVAGLSYLVATTGGAGDDEKLPLIVIAHGLGDRPESMISLYRPLPAKARLVALRAPRPYSNGFSWFPSRFEGADDAAMVDGLRAAATRVADAMKELSRAFPTAGKPIMTGFSQGGMLSFEIGVHHPDAVSAVFPLSGWLPPAMWPDAKTPGTSYPPIHAFHGEADPLLKVDLTRAAVDRLSSLGIPVDLKTYPGVVHRTSDEERRDVGASMSSAVEAARSASP
jgi:phospholipase/carboxylesterase